MGQGPIGMLQASIIQYRQAAIYCSENNILRLGCTFIRAMGAALPKDASFELHEYPKKGKDQTADQYRETLEEWIDGELIRTEDSVSAYVAKFYKQGGSNRLD